MKYAVTLAKTFSTIVEIDADSVQEAIDGAWEFEPQDSIVGFDWDPDGESEPIAVYDEHDEQVWSA